MTWLTPDGLYLVEGAGASLPSWAEAALGPDPVRPARFYLVTPGGEVRRAFSGPLDYAVNDERGLANVHAIAGDALVSYHVIDHRLYDLRVEKRVEVAG